MRRRSIANTAADGRLRGAVREYADARRLGVIDTHIRGLVDTLNVPGVIRTLASCEGHGLLGRYGSPYITFKAHETLAAALHAMLTRDAESASPRLRYHWSVTGHFNDVHGLTFRLDIPNIVAYFWVTRKRLNGDFTILRSMVQQTFDHIHRQNAEMKCQGSDGKCDAHNDRGNHFVPVMSSLLPERVGRIAAATSLRRLAQWFSAVNAAIERHIRFPFYGV